MICKHRAVIHFATVCERRTIILRGFFHEAWLIRCRSQKIRRFCWDNVAEDNVMLSLCIYSHAIACQNRFVVKIFLHSDYLTQKNCRIYIVPCKISFTLWLCMIVTLIYTWWYEISDIYFLYAVELIHTSLQRN